MTAMPMLSNRQKQRYLIFALIKKGVKRYDNI